MRTARATPARVSQTPAQPRLSRVPKLQSQPSPSYPAPEEVLDQSLHLYTAILLQHCQQVVRHDLRRRVDAIRSGIVSTVQTRKGESESEEGNEAKRAICCTGVGQENQGGGQQQQGVQARVLDIYHSTTTRGKERGRNSKKTTTKPRSKDAANSLHKKNGCRF